MESMESGTRNQGAVDAIDSLRKIYAFDQAQITGINNKLLAGIFGVDDISAVNAKTAWATLSGRSQPAMRATAQVLEELNPALLDDIRAEAIRDVVRRSFVPSQRQSISPYSPIRLADQLAGDTGAAGGAFRGLFPAEEALHFKKFGDALRTINETYLTRFEAAASSELRDAGINVVSRSPEFFSRWIIGLLSRSKSVERMLSDPAFREAIIQAADSGLVGPKTQSAMLYMVTTAGQWAASDEAEARRKERDKIEGQIERESLKFQLGD